MKAFDALLSSLDIQGVREAHLHAEIEPNLQSSMFVKACKILRVFWKVFTSMYVSFDLVDFGVSSKFEVSNGFVK